MLIKRFITIGFSLIIAAAIILSAASCSNEQNPGNQDNQGNTNADANNGSLSGDTEPQDIVDERYVYGGERIDFEGEAFNIIYPAWSLYEDYYFAEEQTGDAVNDALYTRIVNTNEFFNIEIKAIEIGSINDVEPAMNREVMSGTNSFDIALTHCVSGLDTIVSKNLAYNWSEMPNVDFSKRYWNQSMNEYLNINGYMPFVANDFIIPDPCFITFSKYLLQQYELEDPYELVNTGRWTWDKLSEMAKKVSQDLDGDGVYTDADLYGFVGELDWQFINAMYSCDQRVMKRDSDGRYTVDINTEKMQSVLDKFYNLIYTGHQTFVYDYDARANRQPYIAFDSGRALFYMNTPSFVMELRATDFDFGILPYPKYNEEQQNYISLNWAGVITAPLNVANPEKVGAVVEYLGAISRGTVMPAYFDILLSGRLVRDDESLEMLDIIYGDSIYDFGLNFSAFNDFLYVVPRLLQEESTDLISFYERRADNIQAQYDRIFDAFVANSHS